MRRFFAALFLCPFYAIGVGLWVNALAAIAMLIAVLFWWAPAHAETCIASHYGTGDGYGGRRTASGERMNPAAMTAAHKTLSFGSHVTVRNGWNSVVVRVNDRGPFVRGRCIDLSTAAMRKVCGSAGTCRVTVTR